jgi:hypothetical protein
VGDGMHWYKLDGTPCYKIVGANGNERSPTVRDAREGIRGKRKGEWVLPPFSIVPSVTTVGHSVGKPDGLVKWIVKTTIECAATNPCREGEDADAYARRLQADADRWRDEAADLGTAIHDAIAEHLVPSAEPNPPDETLAPYVTPVFAWLDANIKTVVLSESSFATPDYGGRIDAYVELADGRCAYVDFKSQGTSEKYGHTTRTYDEWGEQLYAYSAGVGKPWDVLANLVISTTKPGVIGWHEWGGIDRLRRMWNAKLAYFQALHNYYPAQHAGERAAA